MAYQNGPVYQQRYQPAAQQLTQARDLVLAREAVPPGTERADGEPVAARARIALLEAELGARLSIRARATALAAELAAARQRVATLEAAAERAHHREDELEAELVTMRHRQEGSERALEDIKGSASWRMTEPLRSAQRLVRGRAR